jgi:hypothetical protein
MSDQEAYIQVIDDKLHFDDWSGEVDVEEAKARLTILTECIQLAEGYITPAERATLPPLPPKHRWFRDAEAGLCVQDAKGKVWSVRYTDEPLPENTADAAWARFEEQTGVSENDMEIVRRVRDFFGNHALAPADVEGVSAKEVWRNLASSLVVKLGDIIDEES